ncbi:hypothetical protein PtB15_4B512 [Puccinia triticina]|nr:hypothetical protein PtB15_4B512 [Puccinia triticina]
MHIQYSYRKKNGSANGQSRPRARSFLLVLSPVCRCARPHAIGILLSTGHPNPHHHRRSFTSFPAAGTTQHSTPTRPQAQPIGLAQDSRPPQSSLFAAFIESHSPSRRLVLATLSH